MTKLEYDSLYKFLVSLGIILISLPIAAILFLINADTIIIDRANYENLSEYTMHALQLKENLITPIVCWLPILVIIVGIMGIILIVIGILKWHKVQTILDAMIEAEKTKLDLDNSKMKKSEIVEKTISEIEESNPRSSQNIKTIKNHLIEFADIEDRYFSKFLSNSFKSRYILKRDIRITTYQYDGIAISKEDNTDIIFEIKYWRHDITETMVDNSIIRLLMSGENYKKNQHRDYKCVLIIIADNSQFKMIQKMVEHFIQKTILPDTSKLEVSYISQNDI